MTADQYFHIVSKKYRSIELLRVVKEVEHYYKNWLGIAEYELMDDEPLLQIKQELIDRDILSRKRVHAQTEI